MKMLMIVCPQNRQREVQNLIERHAVHAYTEITDVIGEGDKGKRMGTDVWPEKSSLIFTVVAPEKIDELVADLRALAASLFAGEGLSAFVLPVERVL